MALVVNVEFAFHPRETALCVTCRPAKPIMSRKGFAVRGVIMWMAYSTELGAKSVFSDQRANLEGMTQEQEYRLS